jgi:hypothetical protein
MHRILLFLCVLFLLHIPVISQEDEEEIQPPKRSVQSKIGGAGGFTQNLLFMDLNPINEYLRKSRSAEFDKTPMLLLGGQGYGYIMIVRNLRIGGMGAGGSLTSKSIDTLTNTRRNVELSVGFGGVTIEYTIPIVPRLDATIGVLLGSGSTNIRLTRNSNPNKIWDDVWDNFGTDKKIEDYTQNLSGSFFIFQPQLNLEYAVWRWFAIRVGVGYNGMAFGSWTLDDDYELIGVPDKINGRGFMLNGGIYLGTFLY